MCQNEGCLCKLKLFSFVCTLYNMVFSVANCISFFLCPVQYKGWTVQDSRATLHFLLICSVALGRLKQSTRFKHSKPASKTKWLMSSEIFQYFLSLLTLCVLQNYSFVFSVLLENYPIFMEMEFRNTEAGMQCVHQLRLPKCPGAITHHFVTARWICPWLHVKFGPSAYQSPKSQIRHPEEDSQESDLSGLLYHVVFRCPLPQTELLSFNLTLQVFEFLVLTFSPHH